MFGGIGYQEILLVGVIAILLFGKRLPEVARGWGASYRDLRRSLNDIRASFDAGIQEPQRPKRLEADESDRVQEAAPRFVPPNDENGAA